MDLFYRELGEGEQNLLILHGVFGSSDNWMTLARQLAEQYHVWVLDQRNHGKSPHSEAHSYALMVADLKAFVERHELRQLTVMGHSMGGKVAMQFALEHPELLDRLIVVDIAPRAYPIRHELILKAFQQVKLEDKTKRPEVEKELSEYITDFGIRQFIMKNLYRKEDNSFAWRINVDAIAEHIGDIGKATEGKYPFEKPTLFVGGSKSDYIGTEDIPQIEMLFPQSQVQHIANAGHWIHAEQPKAFMEVILPFLADK